MGKIKQVIKMDKFLEEAEIYGIPLESIKGMVERDLEYKADIYKKMKWIKHRQIATLFGNAVIFLLMIFILLRVEQNISNIQDLIKVLVVAFTEMNK